MMITLDRFAEKNPPEINALNKNSRYNIIEFLGRKQAQGCIGLWEGGKVVVCKTGWVGEGVVIYLYSKYR